MRSDLRCNGAVTQVSAVCFLLSLTGKGCWVSQSGGSGCSATCRRGDATHGSPQTAWYGACRCHPCTGSVEYRQYMQHFPQLGAHVGSGGWCVPAYSLWRELKMRNSCCLQGSYENLLQLHDYTKQNTVGSVFHSLKGLN